MGQLFGDTSLTWTRQTAEIIQRTKMLGDDDKSGQSFNPLADKFAQLTYEVLRKHYHQSMSNLVYIGYVWQELSKLRYSEEGEELFRAGLGLKVPGGVSPEVFEWILGISEMVCYTNAGPPRTENLRRDLVYGSYFLVQQMDSNLTGDEYRELLEMGVDAYQSKHDREGNLDRLFHLNWGSLEPTT